MYRCRVCGHTYGVRERIWRCQCGGPLDFISSQRMTRADTEIEKCSLWRYEKVLPLSLADAAASFAEGMTPLVPGTWEGKKVHFKLEYMMPTGSFKDRGNAVLVNWVKMLGIDHVLEDSSGNAGASIAAYCAKAGIQCDVYVPRSTSSGKLFQIGMYGANLVKIDGTRQDVAEAAHRAAKRTFYASHNWHPLFLEGTKTLAYELWEQLGWKEPDTIIVPLGMGSALLGLHKGFSELVEAGQITGLPRLVAVQAENCAPLHSLFHRGHSNVEVKPTLAEGIACADPVRGSQVVAALQGSGGFTDVAQEEEILDAVVRASRMGFCIELTSGAALAGASHMARSGNLDYGTTVIILTGNGLKSADKIVQAMGDLANRSVE